MHARPLCTYPVNFHWMGVGDRWKRWQTDCKGDRRTALEDKELKKVWFRKGHSKVFISTTCVKRPLSKIPKIGFKTNYCLMQVKSIVECSKGRILQYFRPSLSYQLLLSSLFGLFLSGRFSQVLLYIVRLS